MVHGGIQRWEPTSLEVLSERRGIAPMQYRYLLPGLVWAARHHGPVALRAISDRTWEIAFDVLGVVGTWWATSSIIRTTMKVRLGGSALFALLPLPALLLHYVTLRADYFYVYDLPSVAFFTGALAASLARRRALFVALFLIGTVNRESILFVALADLLVWAPSPPERRKAVVRFVLLVAAWALIKAGLGAAFQDNVDPRYSGALWKDVLQRNLDNVLRDEPITVATYWSSIFAYWWVPVLALFRGIRGTALGRVMLIVPPFWLLMLFVGLLEEVRIFGELVPAVFCALLQLARSRS